MPIEQLDVVPSRYRPTTFTADMENFLAWMARNVPNYNALEQSLQLVATTGTSATSLTVGTGSKTLTTQAGKAWAIGSFIYVVSAASVANMMIGQVTAYNSVTGSLTVSVVTSSGAGTLASWVVGLSAPLGSSASFSGSVTAAVLAVDGNFYSALVSGNPVIYFDTNDYIRYDRTNNRMGFSVGGTDQLTVDAIDGPQRTTDASTGNGLTRKAQMDAATVRASLGDVQAGTDTSKIVTPQTLQAGKMGLSSAVAASGVTSIDFTGIPAWTRRVTVLFNGVSTNGTSNLLVQIGSGSIKTTGYASGADNGVASFNGTSGFGVQTALAVYTISGTLTVALLGGNVYVSSHVMGRTDSPLANRGGGTVTLSGLMDRVRLTTENGTDLFDAGSVSIIWE